MCKHSNSLYNCTLYIVKEYFKQTGKYIGYSELYNQIKGNIHYQSLPSKIAQHDVRLVDKNYRSFFALLRKKKIGEFGDKINSPKFKKPNSEFNLILPNDQINLINGKLKITKNIRIPFSYNINGKIKQAIIKPNGNKNYTIYITYEPKESKTDKTLTIDNKLSIDLGVNNLVAGFSNVGPSFIMNGKPLKSYNQNYNKRKAKITSELELKNKKKWSNQLSNITNNRENWVNNYMNQTVAKIIKYCQEHKIGQIIIGYNETWKQNINIGKKNNQTFCSIPHFKLVVKLTNKCIEYGIEVKLQEESYTSKCSFLDNEEMKHKDVYDGKRIHRGLFLTKNGLKINADINGAANIMRKVFSNVNQQLTNEIVGGIVHPVVFQPLIRTNKE